MGTVFVVHLSHLDDKMILKCFCFALSSSSPLLRKTVIQGKRLQRTTQQANLFLQRKTRIPRKTRQVKQTLQRLWVAIGLLDGRQRVLDGGSSWCNYYGCPADHYGTVHPQCCQDSHYCITQRANCQWQHNQINHINNYYGGLVRQVWVWCAATQTWKSMLQMQQPRRVNENLLQLGAAGSNDIKVTLCTCSAGTWQEVTSDATVGQLTSGQQQQIKLARYGYVDGENQVTPTCADLAAHAHAHCPRGSRSWVTLASWISDGAEKR